MIRNPAHIASTLARKAQQFVDPVVSGYWHSAPFGDVPLGSREQYLSLWAEEKASAYPEIDAWENTCGHAVDKEWLDDLALHTQITIKKSAPCYQHGRVLYAALRRYLSDSGQNNPTIIETGTARGFSSVAMARALQDSGAAGKIITLDLLPHHAPIMWNCIDDHDGKRSRADLLKSWGNLVNAYVVFLEGDSRQNLSRIGAGRIHFAFLDGAHEYKDVRFEFDAVAARQMRGDIIVFDDVNDDLFPGVVQALADGCARHSYTCETVAGRDARHYAIARRT